MGVTVGYLLGCDKCALASLKKLNNGTNEHIILQIEIELNTTCFGTCCGVKKLLNRDDFDTNTHQAKARKGKG